MTYSPLEQLSEAISQCRRCDAAGLQVHHPLKLYRGLGKKNVMVVGVQPGNTEKTSGRAFSGNAGTRLLQWLTAAGLGADHEAIFQNVYLTSVVKCASNPAVLNKCAEHCFSWLEKQIQIVQPNFLITLGKPPLQLLFECELQLDEVVGKEFTESQLNRRLFPIVGDNIKLIPFPHPSGMSRWHNDDENKKLIADAINLLKRGVKNA